MVVAPPTKKQTAHTVACTYRSLFTPPHHTLHSSPLPPITLHPTPSLTFSGVSVAMSVGLSALMLRVWGWLPNSPALLSEVAAMGLGLWGDTLVTPLNIGSLRTLKVAMLAAWPMPRPSPKLLVCWLGALWEAKGAGTPCEERYWFTCRF